MIIKEKIVHFYKWTFNEKTFQVIGLQGTKGAGISFRFYLNKDEVEDEDKSLMQNFVRELSQQKK